MSRFGDTLKDRNPVDLRSLIDNTRMSPYQWLIVAVAAFVNALDGYDLVAMAFTSTAVSSEFSLSSSQLGWLLSAALIGIGIGALLLAPLADKFGRRRLIVIALLIDLLGLVMTALAGSFGELLLWRIITGIGVGGILACVTVLVSEFSNLRFRGLAMAIYASGYGVGASLCGVLAANFLPTYGWRSIFVAGAVLTVVSLVALITIVPETPETLAARGQDEMLVALARRIGKPTGDGIAVAVKSPPQKAHLADILNPALIRTTLLLWGAFGTVTFAFNFANQWTPKLLTETGLTAQQGIVGGIMLSFGGTIGSLIYGGLTTRFAPRATLILFAFTSAGVLVAFISTTSLPPLMFAAGVAVGMLLNGCVTGMYTLTPQSYPFHLRATGVGAAIGVSRIGAILGPLVVGYLVDAGWTPIALYAGTAAVILLAGIAVLGIPARYSTTGDGGGSDRREASERASRQKVMEGVVAGGVDKCEIAVSCDGDPTLPPRDVRTIALE